jgi:hypothetical protein
LLLHDVLSDFSHRAVFPLRIPKNKKTGKRQTANATAAQTADDDFHDMLAEVMAEDPASPAVTSSGSAPSSTSAATTSTSSSNTHATEATKEQRAIMQCCFAGDVPKLRQWVRRGVRVVFSAEPLITAAGCGKLKVVRFLIKEAGANVNQSWGNGSTPLYIAAQQGHLPVVQCLVKELGADINKANLKGGTPLMIVARHKQTKVVVWLTKHGADAQASHQQLGTAADCSRNYDAPAKQTEYLEARAHCANPGCDGAGLKKCAGCLKVFFCGPACIRAHWPAHKAECKRIAEATTAKGKAK